jgi:protein-disulfide isomerase
MFGPPQAGPVPVAMFSDFRCPICNVMNGRLAELQTETPNSFRIVRHELPILGGSSNTASRAVLAADLLGAYLEIHTRLARTPAVTDEIFIHALAVRMGLDADRLLRDMTSEAIENKLRVTRGIASLFGFYGTPSFAVGRTIFLGSVSKAILRDLIALEVGNSCQTLNG